VLSSALHSPGCSQWTHGRSNTWKTSHGLGMLMEAPPASSRTTWIPPSSTRQPRVYRVACGRASERSRRGVGSGDDRGGKGRRAENGNDVSEIGGSRHSSAGPDPSETPQTVFALCPLASRLSRNARLCFRSLTARAHRRLRLAALSAPFPCLLTRGCTVSHCAAFRGCTRVGGWRLGSTPALPGRGTAPWLASALCMNITYTLCLVYQESKTYLALVRAGRLSARGRLGPSCPSFSPPAFPCPFCRSVPRHAPVDTDPHAQA
jgi:hypothetical protein